MTTLGFALALWVMLSSLRSRSRACARASRCPAAVLGMVIAHFGVGLATLGITGVQSFKVEKDFALGVGESATIAGYEFKFAALRGRPRPELHAASRPTSSSRATASR